MPDYPSFPKIPRLHREVVITEKIDGTNGLIEVRARGTSEVELPPGETGVTVVDAAGLARSLVIRAGSRNRWLTPEQDNAGFGRWVGENATQLAALGEGRHYGEWFGKGVQRGYGMSERAFALFNVGRWYDARTEDEDPEGFPNAVACPEVVTTVPVLWTGNARDLNKGVTASMAVLSKYGSVAVGGFMNPEGLMVYHLAGGHYFKVLRDNDDMPKGAAA